MRELNFDVRGQSILKDKKCNFDGIVSGTKNYLFAKFSFDGQWSGMSKVAVFKCLNKEYPTKIKNNRCAIPSDALIWSSFSLYVVGQDKDGVRIKTGAVSVSQEVT